MDGNLIVLEGDEYGTNKLCNNFEATALIKELYVPGRILARYEGVIGRGTMASLLVKAPLRGMTFSNLASS